MNDPTYVEAARVLAARALRESETVAGRIEALFRRILVRSPSVDELAVLAELLGRYRERFNANPESAREFLKVGEAPVDASLDPADLAAMSAIAATVLNLDEAVTRE
jgi:hypothetical protein